MRLQITSFDVELLRSPSCSGESKADPSAPLKYALLRTTALIFEWACARCKLTHKTKNADLAVRVLCASWICWDG
jgi:hypothetical protein